MNTIEIYPVFSKPIYVNVLETISDKQLLKVKNIIENCNYTNSTNYALSNKNKFSKISTDLNLLDNKNLSFLKKILINEFNIFKNDILKYHNNNFEITTSWISKTEPGEESEWHQHNNCMYSGIFYINTSENSGDISFETHENKRFQLIPTEFNIYNSASFTFKPLNNMIILFESQLFHKIFKNNSNMTRYSIAFNVMPVGKIGSSDSFCNLANLKQ
jgi:uncharacterized protein (TIGR02466 family)